MKVILLALYDYHMTKKALADGVIQEDDVSGNTMRLGEWSYVYQRGGHATV